MVNINSLLIYEREMSRVSDTLFIGWSDSPHCENLGFSCMGLLRLSLSEAFAPSGRNN